MTYDELEPYYDRSKSSAASPARPAICAARRSTGGNIFEGPRQNEYPNPPLKLDRVRLDVREGGEGARLPSVPAAGQQHERGLHQPRGPHARRLPILRPLRADRLRGQCQGVAARLHPAAAAADPKFKLRTYAWVNQLVYDKAAKKVTGVRLHRYPQRRGIRAAGRPRRARGLCVQQHAADAHSGIGEPYDPATGKGAVGKNYCYQVSATA